MHLSGQVHEYNCYIQWVPAAAPPPASYAPSRRVCSVDEPMSPEEGAMDLLDFVNLKVFGNSAFREQQRRVIETVLKVKSCPTRLLSDTHAPILLPCMQDNFITLVFLSRCLPVQDHDAFVLMPTGGGK